jgi:hypothetical protein
MRFLTLARYILELSLQDYGFCTVSDSLKACASLYLALKMAVKYEQNMRSSSPNGDNLPEADLIVSASTLAATEWVI